MILWLTRRSYAAYLVFKVAKALTFPLIVVASWSITLWLSAKAAIAEFDCFSQGAIEFAKERNYFTGFSREYYRSLWHQKEPK